MSKYSATLLFDFDDTIIINTAHYISAKTAIASKIQEQVTAYGISDIIKIFDAREKLNINSGKPTGHENFRVSLMQAAHALCDYGFFSNRYYNLIDGEVSALYNRPLEVIKGVEETIKTLSMRGHDMYILTLGRREEQERKFANLPFNHCFSGIEYMDRKDGSEYLDFLTGKGIDRSNCYMIGNSITSDIAPLKTIGVKTILIPNQDRFEDFNPKMLRAEPQTIVLTCMKDILELDL